MQPGDYIKIPFDFHIKSTGSWGARSSFLMVTCPRVLKITVRGRMLSRRLPCDNMQRLCTLFEGAHARALTSPTLTHSHPGMSCLTRVNALWAPSRLLSTEHAPAPPASVGWTELET